HRAHLRLLCGEISGKEINVTVVDTRLSVWEALAGRAPGQPVGVGDPGLWVTVRRLPSAGFSITIRVAVTADASAIGRLTTAVGTADGVVTALDVVDSDHTRVIADLTCDTADAAHADQVVADLEAMDGVEVRKVSDRTFLLHL